MPSDQQELPSPAPLPPPTPEPHNFASLKKLLSEDERVPEEEVWAASSKAQLVLLAVRHGVELTRPVEAVAVSPHSTANFGSAAMSQRRLHRSYFRTQQLANNRSTPRPAVDVPPLAMSHLPSEAHTPEIPLYGGQYDRPSLGRLSSRQDLAQREAAVAVREAQVLAREGVPSHAGLSEQMR